MKETSYYDYVSDRIKSLLQRWDNFSKKEMMPPSELIKGLMQEINDGTSETAMHMAKAIEAGKIISGRKI